MFSKGIILSLGLSLCSVVLVYLYVKNRINNLENKVDKLIQVIQMFQQPTHPQMAGAQEYEKIVVSDDEESSEEESSDDEEDEDEEVEEQHEQHQIVAEEDNHVLQTSEETDVRIKEEVEEEVEQQMLKLSKGGEGELLEMEEQDLTPDADDGLDEMDDLDEDLEEEDEDEDGDEDGEEVDYSKMGKVQLRELCETKGFDTKGKKKHELLELLNN